MAKLGSKKQPVAIRVQNKTSAGEIISIYKKYGWHFIVGIEPESKKESSLELFNTFWARCY